MTIKTIFLDRDGVINKEVNYLYKIEEFEFIDGIFEACKYFLKLGYKIIIITNQSGISKGYYSENDFQITTQWMIKEFQKNDVTISDIFHCPHSPEENCPCRKPMPGMIIKAQEKYNINLASSWLIGDKEADIIAANKSGILQTILVRSGHKINEFSSKAHYIVDSVIDSKNIIRV
jgi:D-glycero-D-manno-heptose 1,7-bisphosphate phosphatase